jgi:hypothetical protein
LSQWPTEITCIIDEGNVSANIDDELGAADDVVIALQQNSKRVQQMYTSDKLPIDNFEHVAATMRTHTRRRRLQKYGHHAYHTRTYLIMRLTALMAINTLVGL